MAKRVRVLIYDGSEEWIESQRQHEWAKTRTNRCPHQPKYGPAYITSIDLDPMHLTISGLLRLFWREAGRLG